MKLLHEFALVINSRIITGLVTLDGTATFHRTMKHQSIATLTKVNSALLCSMVALAVSLVARAADGPAKPQQGRLQHVVSFKFKENVTKEQIQQVEQAFRTLRKKVSQVKNYEWGTNVSTEKRDKGFTHCFILTFKTEKDRDDYLVHPEHAAFVKVVLPLVEDVFVIDFWAKD